MIGVIAGIVVTWFQFTKDFFPWTGGVFPLP